jgi:TRAP-type C4-dicarboxylate transport system substrate-binding protein
MLRTTRPRRPTRAALTATVLIAVVAAPACSTTGTAGKGGLPRHGAVELGFTDRASVPDGYSDGGVAFVDGLREESGGLLTATATSMHDLGPEGLLQQVRAGRVQGAWVPAAELEAAGLGHFAALSAPFVVTTYDAQAAVTAPEVAEPFLESLDGTGLTGLALLAGPLRRPAGMDAPMLGPATWRGATVWARGPTQAATFAALGAEPVSAPGDARVTDLGTVLLEDEAAAAPYLTTNVVLWPRTWVLVVNTDWRDSLTEQEREWLDTAAEAARLASVTDLPDESAMATRLCELGARFATATPRDVVGLHRAVAPVVRAIAADPDEGPLLSRVTSVVGQIPDTTDVTGAPGYCHGRASPLEQVGGYPTTPAGIPPGTYRAHLSAADIAAAGALKTRDAQVVTLVIGEDGTYRNTSRFDNDGEEMIFEAGRVWGEGRTAYFVNSLDRLRDLQARGEPACVWDQPALGCITNTEPYSVTWALEPDGSLQFSDPRGMNPDPVSILSLVANPFHPVE